MTPGYFLYGDLEQMVAAEMEELGWDPFNPNHVLEYWEQIHGITNG